MTVTVGVQTAELPYYTDFWDTGLKCKGAQVNSLGKINSLQTEFQSCVGMASHLPICIYMHVQRYRTPPRHGTTGKNSDWMSDRPRYVLVRNQYYLKEQSWF